MQTESTGNGFKSGYASTIGVSPMNCCIVPGEKSLQQLEETMKNGLVITDLQGLHAGIDLSLIHIWMIFPKKIKKRC